MNKFLHILLSPASATYTQIAICFIRVGIGIVMTFHGAPKIMGGVEAWHMLGKFMAPLGIHAFPLMWGVMGAVTEFFGGILFMLGLGTRLASVCLAFMMFVATMWHIDRGDSFQVYSHPLALMIIFLGFLIMGSGTLSVDNYLVKKYS